MVTYLMFGKYSMEGIRKICAERTVQTKQLATKFGGEVKEMYALLGENDLVFIVTFPGVEEAMKFSVALTKMLDISFTTSPAVTAEKFDEIVAGL